MVERTLVVDVIIPVLNEEKSIAKVIQSIPVNQVRNVVVVDNGSTDNTKEVVMRTNALLISEEKKGYGSACFKGVEYLLSLEHKPAIVVFMDGDFSDYPEEISKLVLPITEQQMDVVIGSRTLGIAQKGSLTLPQRFGNWLATKLLYQLYKARYTDLGPFRAIRLEALEKLNMQDRTYGWTIEMQLKAAKMGMSYCEVPVSYRKRIGTSKISGTVKGSVLAGFMILKTIFKYR